MEKKKTTKKHKYQQATKNEVVRDVEVSDGST